MSFPFPARADAALSSPFGVYDFVYIALAKRERATTLVTANRRQAEIARTLSVPVSTM